MNQPRSQSKDITMILYVVSVLTLVTTTTIIPSWAATVAAACEAEMSYATYGSADELAVSNPARPK